MAQLPNLTRELRSTEVIIRFCRREFDTAAQCVKKALELHPDLIVLDLSMPVMNGLDAARELKRLMPTVPLIMYSALGLATLCTEAR